MMLSLQHMEEMNVPSNLRLIATKLPYKLQERWRTVACELQENRGTRVIFSDLVNFIEGQVKLLSDPIFGNILEVQPHNSRKDKIMTKSLNKERGSAAVAAVNTSEKESSERQANAATTPFKDMVVFCCACKGSHALEQCSQLKIMTHCEKINIFRENGI